MTKVHLGFKAFDIHELLTHFVAQRGGFYQQQALEVGLIDSTFIPDDKLPPNTFHAACGAALMGYVNGANYKVLLVNTDRPMFWLYSTNGEAAIAELAGKRVASYPGLAPPAHFLAAISASVNPQLLPVGTDVARIGMLKSGDVDAALISSAYPPAVMADLGFTKPLLVGDTFRAPTTGLAINSPLLLEQPELVQKMTSAHQQGITAIHNDDGLLETVLTEDFGLPFSAVGATTVLVRGLFTADGRSTKDVEQGAMTAMAGRLGVSNLPAEPLYDYSLLA